jgi:hypothetical protein
MVSKLISRNSIYNKAQSLGIVKSNEFRICPICNKILSRKEFANRQNGNSTAYCKICTKTEAKKYSDKLLSDWTKFFVELYGQNPSCAICGEILQWHSSIKSKAVHFDHRKPGIKIKCIPRLWYCGRPCTEANKSEWIVENFGILCLTCNFRTPTKNRLAWLKLALEYTQNYTYFFRWNDKKQYYLNKILPDITYNNIRYKSLNQWREFFKLYYTINPCCQICGRWLNWNFEKNKSVFFDHRLDGKESIKCSPSRFYRDNLCTKTRIELWMQSNFGILCHDCNYRLPTISRIDWLNKALKYSENITCSV